MRGAIEVRSRQQLDNGGVRAVATSTGPVCNIAGRKRAVAASADPVATGGQGWDLQADGRTRAGSGTACTRTARRAAKAGTAREPAARLCSAEERLATEIILSAAMKAR
jgi:hypothetical protein